MFRVFLGASVVALAGAAFSLREAQTALWLSAAAYCDRETYTTRTFTGPTTGFVVTKVIYDLPSDTNGFVGYLPSDSTIYISFRGSQTLRNWITNLDFEKTAYTSFPECACEVHEGFYEAEQAVIDGIVSEVKKLKKQFPSYKVKNTGHSLGGALAQLTSMDLYKAGIYNTVYDFGQPRTGDEHFAEFASSLAAYVPTYRIVHDQDIVPHLPATKGTHLLR